MKDFGPTRGETRFYLIASLGGLVLLAGVVAFRGVGGIAAVEVVGIAGAFFGGTAVWAARRLRRMR